MIDRYHKDSMPQYDLHEDLNGMLQAYAVAHRNGTVSDVRYIIVFGDAPKVEVSLFNYPLCPYFDTEETAQEAIEKIVKPFLKRNPQFIW